MLYILFFPFSDTNHIEKNILLDISFKYTALVRIINIAISYCGLII